MCYLTYLPCQWVRELFALSFRLFPFYMSTSQLISLSYPPLPAMQTRKKRLIIGNRFYRYNAQSIFVRTHGRCRSSSQTIESFNISLPSPTRLVACWPCSPYPTPTFGTPPGIRSRQYVFGGNRLWRPTLRATCESSKYEMSESLACGVVGFRVRCLFNSQRARW